jgi:hypothetical protein
MNLLWQILGLVAFGLFPVGMQSDVEHPARLQLEIC